MHEVQAPHHMQTPIAHGDQSNSQLQTASPPSTHPPEGTTVHPTADRLSPDNDPQPDQSPESLTRSNATTYPQVAQGNARRNIPRPSQLARCLNSASTLWRAYFNDRNRPTERRGNRPNREVTAAIRREMERQLSETDSEPDRDTPTPSPPPMELLPLYRNPPPYPTPFVPQHIAPPPHPANPGPSARLIIPDNPYSSTQSTFETILDAIDRQPPDQVTPHQREIQRDATEAYFSEAGFNVINPRRTQFSQTPSNSNANPPAFTEIVSFSSWDNPTLEQRENETRPAILQERALREARQAEIYQWQTHYNRTQDPQALLVLRRLRQREATRQMRQRAYIIDSGPDIQIQNTALPPPRSTQTLLRAANAEINRRLDAVTSELQARLSQQSQSPPRILSETPVTRQSQSLTNSNRLQSQSPWTSTGLRYMHNVRTNNPNIRNRRDSIRRRRENRLCRTCIPKPPSSTEESEDEDHPNQVHLDVRELPTLVTAMRDTLMPEIREQRPRRTRPNFTQTIFRSRDRSTPDTHSYSENGHSQVSPDMTSDDQALSTPEESEPEHIYSTIFDELDIIISPSITV